MPGRFEVLVPAVVRDLGTPEARSLHVLDLGDLEHLEFAAGSMGPKVEATGYAAAIGSLTDAAAVLDGGEGTTISKTSP